MDYVRDLDTPLLRLSPKDAFTLRDACQGVHVFGGIGSGKTSGSGKALAGAFLRAGMGGLVLCAKPDEVETWLRYAREHGRSNSVLLFGQRGGGFNFIAYELARQGEEGIGSVVECLMRIVEAARLTNPNAGKSSESFWEDATRQLLRNSLPMLYAATGTVNMADIVRFVASAPPTREAARDEAWQKSSFMFATMLTAAKEPVRPMRETDYKKISLYWRDEFASLDPKTRGNIVISLSTALDRFNRGRLHEAFCAGTTLVPELTFHGAIIVLDMSALTWNEDGIIGQQLFKYMWQRAVLARNDLEPKHRDRPVFLWADEAQFFVNSADAIYQSTCRSSRACTVYLSQSLPTYYARIGGERPEHDANQFLGNFSTKVFHNNADPETNKWAAETIGRVIHQRGSFSENETFGRSRGMGTSGGTNWNSSWGSSSSHSDRGGGSTSSNYGGSAGGNEGWNRSRGVNSGSSVGSGYSEQMDYEIEPGDFARYLQTGGPANGGIVSAIWFQAGKHFRDSDRNYLFTRFRQ